MCRDGTDAFIGRYSNLHDVYESNCHGLEDPMCKFNCTIGTSAEFTNTKCSIFSLEQSLTILKNHRRQIVFIGDSYTGQLHSEARLWCHRHNSSICENFIRYLAPHLTRFRPPQSENDTLTKAILNYPNATDFVVTSGNHWGPQKGFVNISHALVQYREMLLEAADVFNRWNPDVHLIWYDIPPPHHLLIESGPNQILYNHLARDTLKSLLKNIIFLNTSEFILERIRLQPHTTANRHYCQGHVGSVPEALFTRILSLLATWVI